MPNRLILLFLALAMGGFAIGTTEFATMSMLPLIERGFGIDKATAGLAISVYALGVVVGAPVIVVLSARIPRRPLLIGLMAGFGLAHLAAAAAPTFAWFCFFRFVSGLPHGAYFGLAALAAASVVPVHRQTQAVGYVMLGLTTATIVGVPAATWLAEWLGWRASYLLIAALALTAAVLIRVVVPYTATFSGTNPLREMSALKRIDVWLTLAIGAVGFGGVFAIYAYLTSALDVVTGIAEPWIPLVFGVFGVGMTAGNVVIPRFADRARMPTAGVTLAGISLVMGLYYFAVLSVATVVVTVFLLGFGTALATVLQTRLMDVSGSAQNLPAALNHVAFNLANAIGPLLAALVLASGFGLRILGPLAAGLALIGLAIWALAWRRSRIVPAQNGCEAS